AHGRAAAVGAGRAHPARGDDHGDALRSLRWQPAHPGRDRARARAHQGADPPAGEAVALQAAAPVAGAAAARLCFLTTGPSYSPHLRRRAERRTRPPAGSGALCLPPVFPALPGPCGTGPRTALGFPSRLHLGEPHVTDVPTREGPPMDDDSLIDELQEDLGSDYSPQLRVATGMLSGDAQAAVPYLLFSIAKSLEDISFLLSNDSVSVVMETDEDE